MKTQCSKANSRLKNQLQRLGVLLLDFYQKKCPAHPFTWGRKVGQGGVYKIELTKVLQQKNWPKKPHPSFPLKKMDKAINYKRS